MNPSEPNKTFYLEMVSSDAFLPTKSNGDLKITIVNPPDASINHRFYVEIGAHWKWIDRLSWSKEEWKNYVSQTNIITGVGMIDGNEIGFFELKMEDNGDLEIVYFGLLSSYLGQGLGSSLLTETIRQAWNLPHTKRIWLHTCTNDHEHALSNYEARGFKVYKTEIGT